MASSRRILSGSLRGRLSIVIPALNEERCIGRALASVAGLGAEIIVADGGSRDMTCDIAARHGARLVAAPQGRGHQLCAGADAATGESLLFLHADSFLGDGAEHALRLALADPGFQIGTFRLRFAEAHPLYSFYCWFTRFDSIWSSFGDQGIIVRRTLYDRIGGFPLWPLLEDVEFLRGARRLARVRSLAGEIVTSARRFQQIGMLRQQIRNAGIILKFLRGVSPEVLARVYRGEGRESRRAPLPT